MAKTKTTTYQVNLRYGFTLCVPVDAASREEAIRIAREQCEGSSPLDGITDDDIEFIDAET